MKRYSFADTITIVNGIEITGWADGDDVIDIERRNDSITDKIGAGGEMMVSVGTDKSGSIKFKLLQTSPSNTYLIGLMALQEAAGALFVPAFVKFQDTYRQDLAIGTQGYLKKPAKMTRGAQGNIQEWEIVVERLDLAFGLV
ncbi:hypothetical protein [Caudoviricetes sp.]|nr:hypothetical protein [Caudoviricetes sp.]